MPQGNPMMGELMDALNEMDDRTIPREFIISSQRPNPSFADLAAQAFRSASRRVNGAIELLLEPNMPLDTLSRWTRRAPLPALAIAFLVGVRVARHRR
jgi:hypothetical protein